MYSAPAAGDQPANPSNLYIGNLPYQTTQEDLEQIFGEFGEIASAKLVTDFRTGRSKGFGFVEFVNAADAEKAIEAMNETEIEGRTIFVKVAQPPRPREDRRGGGNRGGGGGYGRRDDNRGGGGYGRRDNNRGGGGYGRRDDRGGSRDF